MKEITGTVVLEQNPPVETVYFGGGTPSLLEEEDLKMIMTALRKKFSLTDSAEITLEANPDDIDNSRLTIWKQEGINRLSIGIQSFFEADLLWMNRAHSAQQAADCVPRARDAGFENLSIDLIYGTPTLSDDNWEQNIAKATGYRVPHLSCYALTVEPSTALKQLIDKQKIKDVDPEQQARQFLKGSEWLETAGYEHYEISNFSLPGKRSRHNSSYWQGKPYYGFGPSAHAFDGNRTRSWNIANNALYIKALTADEHTKEKELLSEVQQLNEYIMTSLRLTEGIHLEKVTNQFGAVYKENIIRIAQPYLADKLRIENNYIRLTKKGKLFADGIAADMFQE